jgi:hypothetical protein
VVAVDIDGVDIEQATGFVAAVRRHPCTEQLALIGVSRWPDRRHAVVAVGADLAVSTTQQLTAAISFITGAALDPHEAVTASPATAAGAAVRALPEQEPSPCASSATRALAG